MVRNTRTIEALTTDRKPRQFQRVVSGQENFAFVICVLAFICVHLRFMYNHLRSYQYIYDIITACHYL